MYIRWKTISLMERWKPYTLVVFFLLSFSACKEDPLETVPREESMARPDSLAFEINGKTYTANRRNSGGFGNRQVNIKPYNPAITGRRAAYETGNRFWYGDTDSTLFDAFFNLKGEKELNDVEISFSRKLHNDQLKKGALFLYLENRLSLFSERRQRFAVDLDMENSTDGVSLKVSLDGVTGILTSHRPGFSIAMRPDMPGNIQENSSFEITRIERLANNHMIVNAKFELNLYDQNGNLYRLKKGFLRFRTIIKANSEWDL